MANAELLLMTFRSSKVGPKFPEQLVDALLTGDVVFLCGAGVSAPQLPGFSALVTRCFAGLNVDMSASEQLSFKENRFEETLGSLSRRIVNLADMTRAVVAARGEAGPEDRIVGIGTAAGQTGGPLGPPDARQKRKRTPADNRLASHRMSRG
ncbi:hypothetical protein [Sphingomonas sp. TDK1]|uniref:hypothetical protein n=1 Tax=Sphingomonas sp. TDK1 TaxID=453247 RepID=UPI0018DBB587|nr:hypothetical protein [Sphingomonas sp. TDK1]